MEVDLILGVLLIHRILHLDNFHGTIRCQAVTSANLLLVRPLGRHLSISLTRIEDPGRVRCLAHLLKLVEGSVRHGELILEDWVLKSGLAGADS